MLCRMNAALAIARMTAGAGASQSPSVRTMQFDRSISNTDRHMHCLMNLQLAASLRTQ
jgi:hypothetical protein